jgi:holo-[acyl-carrier protein] synthase
MILGIGIDLVEVSRIASALERGERFTRRLFTPQEIAYCLRHKEPARHFAARFAAKEAGMKALGTGWSNGVGWKNFEVRIDAAGRPLLLLTGRAAEIAVSMGATHTVVSLAHDGGFATAVAAIEGEANPAAEAWLTGRSAIDVSTTEEAIEELLERTPGVSTTTPSAEPAESGGPEGADDEKEPRR